jgi:hypothetical protein
MKAPPSEGGASQGRGMMSRLKDTPRISAINDYRVTQTGLSTNQENVLLKPEGARPGERDWFALRLMRTPRTAETPPARGFQAKDLRYRAR